MSDMWFGTQGYMQWVPCPTVDSAITREKWSTKTSYLNGGAYTRGSATSHREYVLDWGLDTRANIRKITDVANGIYGDGLTYFVDPFAADANVAPLHWSFPALGAKDAPVLDGTYNRPSITPTISNGLGYPVQSAVYNVSGTPTFGPWIPIPPGYTLWAGAHGSASGGAVRIVPTTGVGVEGAGTNLTMLPETSTTRVNFSLASTAANGAYLRLGGSGQVIISGIIVQLLPTGTAPTTGGFIAGSGNSGCRFDGTPREEFYNAAMDYVGLTASLVEVGDWL